MSAKTKTMVKRCILAGMLVVASGSRRVTHYPSGFYCERNAHTTDNNPPLLTPQHLLLLFLPPWKTGHHSRPSWSLRGKKPELLRQVLPFICHLTIAKTVTACLPRQGFNTAPRAHTQSQDRFPWPRRNPVVKLKLLRIWNNKHTHTQKTKTNQPLLFFC